MSQQQVLVSYPWRQIIVASADFDGTNDFMTRGAGLTGASDDDIGILSFWARFDAGTGGQIILDGDTVLGGGANPRVQVNRATSSGVVSILGYNLAGTNILDLRTTSTFSAGTSWWHFLASWDLSAAATHFYVNDASDKNAVTVTSSAIDYTLADWGIGASPSGGNKFDGCLSEVYFAPNQFLDFSTESNRRKFISAIGKPVSLGTDGSTPTGVAPLVYQRLAGGEAVANFATNRGTGGDFTITGTLDTGSTSPSG